MTLDPLQKPREQQVSGAEEASDRAAVYLKPGNSSTPLGGTSEAHVKSHSSFSATTLLSVLPLPSPSDRVSPTALEGFSNGIQFGA